MIIGKNNFPSEQQRFNTRLEEVNKQAQKGQTNQWNLIENDPLKGYDVTDRNEMADKTLSMLQERLNNGLISMEEFHRQCQKINKMRQ